MILLLAWLLVCGVVQASAPGNDNQLCNAIQQSILSKKAKRESDWDATNENVVETLFQWCVEDAGCSQMYFQHNQRNMTVFKVLLGDHFTGDQMQMEYAALKLFCNRSEVEEMKKTSWVALMKHEMSNARVPIYCTVNEQLVFDPVTMTYDCVCMTHKDCEEGAYPKTFYYIIIVMFSVFLIVYFFGSGYYMVLLTNMYAHIVSKKKKGSLSKTEAALKALSLSQL